MTKTFLQKLGLPTGKGVHKTADVVAERVRILEEGLADGRWAGTKGLEDKARERLGWFRRELARLKAGLPLKGGELTLADVRAAKEEAKEKARKARDKKKKEEEKAAKEEKSEVVTEKKVPSRKKESSPKAPKAPREPKAPVVRKKEVQPQAQARKVGTKAPSGKSPRGNR